MLEVLDVIFHFIHVSIIIIAVTFWMSYRTLRLAQVILILIVISWVGFGFFYGFGYCFITEWHWKIKENLGQSDLPSSYIKFAMDRLTGKDWNSILVERITFSGLLFSIAGCVIQTVRKRKSAIKTAH